MSWRARVESLCYEGETVDRRFDLDEGTLVVTSHRLLAVTPGSADAEFRSIDRPAVAGVRVEIERPTRLLRWAALAGVGGLALVGVATTVSFADPVRSADVEGGVVAPGAADAVESVAGALELLDAVVFWGGVAACAVAVALVGCYVRSRRRRLVVAVPGEPDLELPVSSPPPGLAGSIEDAVAPGDEYDPDSRTDVASDPDPDPESASGDRSFPGPYPDPNRRS